MADLEPEEGNRRYPKRDRKRETEFQMKGYFMGYQKTENCRNRKKERLRKQDERKPDNTTEN